MSKRHPCLGSSKVNIAFTLLVREHNEIDDLKQKLSKHLLVKKDENSACAG